MTDHQKTSFALFKDGIQVSKAHSTRGVAMMEAFERKAVVSWRQDFWSDPAPGLAMVEGYEVKELPHAD